MFFHFLVQCEQAFFLYIRNYIKESTTFYQQMISIQQIKTK